MTTGTLIRQARMRAGLSQVELSARSGKDRAQIARWERDVVVPSLETLRQLLRACGFDLELAASGSPTSSSVASGGCSTARTS